MWAFPAVPWSALLFSLTPGREPEHLRPSHSGSQRAGAGGQQPGSGRSFAWCAPHTSAGPVCLAGVTHAAAANASSVAFGQTQVLDTGSLLRSCVQSAVGMLRDQHAGRQCGMRRVQVLLDLLQDDAGEGPVAAPPAP